MGLLISGAGATMAVGGFLARSWWTGSGSRSTRRDGAILPLLAMLTWPGIRNADRAAVVDTKKLTRIRADPLFAPRRWR